MGALLTEVSQVPHPGLGFVGRVEHRVGVRKFHLGFHLEFAFGLDFEFACEPDFKVAPEFARELALELESKFACHFWTVLRASNL